MNRHLAGAVLLLAVPAIVHADDMAERQAKSVAVVQDFMGKLKGQLGAAIKAGGPVNAIKVCNEVAPQIAAAESERTGWKVARTSLKTRNANNTPDAWELKVMQAFEERKAKGEDVNKLAYAEVVEQDGKQVYRFMKAIPTGEVCLKCHGENLDPAVIAKLDALYPQDTARGFKLGDIRGAFTITQPM